MARWGLLRAVQASVLLTAVALFAASGVLPVYAGGPAVVPAVPGQNLPGQVGPGMMPPGSPDAAAAPGAQAAQSVSAAGGYLLGTDVSSYQHPGGLAIDWSAVAASGESFTVVKATESTDYVNPYMAVDVTSARAAGLVVGLYHFARPEVSATAQADYFARQVNGVAGTQLPPVLDLEQTGGLTSTALVGWASTFLTRLRQDTGRVPMIYSGPYFWSTAMAGTVALSRYPLWEAHYTTAAQPQSINGWPAWSLWQYSNGTYASPAPVPGIHALVDRDRFGGTKAQLLALAASSRPGVQPPFTGTATAAQFPDSSFIRIVGDPHVYEVAGRSPLWVTNWSSVGGPHPVRAITLAQFYSLRSSPLDGTFLVDRADGHAYRMSGGAPVVMTSWVPFGGVQPYVLIDGWDIAHAGTCGGYCHLSSTPRDGTFLRSAETGQIYVVAGGAPIYVSTWTTFGGAQPYININQTALDRAGQGSYWNHLNFTPADGTMISDGTTGSFYLVTGGRPSLSTTTAAATSAFTLVDHAAIANAGGAGVWAHLK